MNPRLDELARRRAQLSAEIAANRSDLADAAQSLHGPLARIDRARETFHYVKQNYALLLLPVALLAVLNPGRTLRLLLGAVSVWRAVERIRAETPPMERL